jgi:hypothetical protein
MDGDLRIPQQRCRIDDDRDRQHDAELREQWPLRADELRQQRQHEQQVLRVRELHQQAVQRDAAVGGRRARRLDRSRAARLRQHHAGAQVQEV